MPLLRISLRWQRFIWLEHTAAVCAFLFSFTPRHAQAHECTQQSDGHLLWRQSVKNRLIESRMIAFGNL